MGVPALFRWLSQKYPKIIYKVFEEKPQEIDGEQIPVDTTKPNPNGDEFDNLYLDMNGIVHPCSHPEDKPAPSTEAEMMLEIFKYTDRIVNMVRPRKLLMLAVDGVAPRAKMNQQRSRRFRAAQEAKEKDQEKQEFMKLLKAQNGGILPESALEESAKKTWDSNAITPGTPFMDTLALSLRYWVAYKLNTDPAWENLKIIISDATVPGEGEHKIMEFIRSQRSSPEHDPNTRHVICGLDADLIMLGLATHEPYFRVLREDVFFQEGKPRTCRKCGQTGHFADECRGEVKQKQGEFDEKAKVPSEKPFIWLDVSILREYLAEEMRIPHQDFPFDLERAIDDWVFMCFFVGNDFLPHLPSLDIREQGIDTLIAIWRDNVPVMGGYVTKDGFVDIERVQLILAGLAKQEDAIFKRRKQEEDRREERSKRRKMNDSDRKPPRRSGDSFTLNENDLNLRDLNTIRDTTKTYRDVSISNVNGSQPQNANGITHDMVMNRSANHDANQQANKSAAAILKERLKARQATESQDTTTTTSDAQTNGADTEPQTPLSGGSKRKRDGVEDDDDDVGTPGRKSPDPTATAPKQDPDELPQDEVRLWEDGYADRYYEQKFKVDPGDHAFRHQVARDYVEGLAWVLLYYFQGCPSWTWYYPHHYAPFAADFVDLHKAKLDFHKGTPFRPFEQLMGVLPAASSHAIPEPLRALMTDESSDIVDFYPEDFPVDLNGKKFAWQGVAILPFIDEKRLLAAMATKYPLLTEADHKRNEFGKDLLLFSDRHDLYESVAANFYSKKQGSPKLNISPRVSGGLAGKVEKNEDYFPASSLQFPLPQGGMPDLDDDRSISVHYEMPKSVHIHKSMLLRGVNPPPPTLTDDEREQTKARARRSGRSHGGVPFRGDDRRNGNNRHFNDRRGPPPINYAAQPPSLGAPSLSDHRPNPFASHLNPSFFPNGIPPPPVPNGSNWVPPPPPGFQQPPAGGFGRGGMPPMGPARDQQMYGGYQHPPNYGGGRGGGQGNYNGGHGRGGHRGGGGRR